MCLLLVVSQAAPSVRQLDPYLKLQSKSPRPPMSLPGLLAQVRPAVPPTGDTRRSCVLMLIP